jgi:hypothetical protein
MRTCQDRRDGLSDRVGAENVIRARGPGLWCWDTEAEDGAWRSPSSTLPPYGQLAITPLICSRDLSAVDARECVFPLVSTVRGLVHCG